MKKRFFLVLVMILVALFAVSCTVELRFAEAKVSSVSVSGISKRDYVRGEALYLQGATLVVTYTDGEIEEIELTSDMLSGYDMNTPEENKAVTVSYGNKTTSFTINVYDLEFESVRLSSLPLRRQYVEGETISPQGARLALTYSGGKTVYSDVTKEMLQTYDNTRLGDQDIYISFYGYRLSFTVTFIEKTVTGLSVLREPAQTKVFVGYGDRLSLDGMKLKLKCDNELAPEVNATDILDDLVVYVDDRYVRTERARVAYLPSGYPESFTYSFAGSAMVKTGDKVTPGTELAGNGQLANVVSKSYGVVTSVSRGSLTVSTVVSYDYTEVSVEEGEVLNFNDPIGRYGGSNIYADAGGGVVTSIRDGKVYIQTAPVAQFSINVQDRGYERMEIKDYPVTTKFASTMDHVIQGDSIDLSTGSVRVFFDNGEEEVLPMNNRLIKLVNSDDDLLRSEIENFSFTSVDNVSGLPSGRYELLYGVKHSYPEDRVTIVVTVVDEDGNNVYVDRNRYVSLDEGKNYTVSIVATLSDAGVNKVSECVYYLATVGAGVRRSQLDITAAGWHRLNVIYGGVKANSIDMLVFVSPRYPVRLDIYYEDGVTTDNITGKEFRVGDTLPLTTLRYIVTYNNGDVSEPQGATTDMLTDDSDLYCSEVTDEKVVRITLPDEDVEPIELKCRVVPLAISSIEFLSDPSDVYLTGPAVNGSNDVSLTGGVLRVYYENSKVAVVGRDLENELPVLKGKTSGERVELSYPLVEDQPIPEVADIYDIYRNDLSYVATLTYYDQYGASASCDLKYYLIPTEVSSIRVTSRADYYKDTYTQCEEWDLTGVSITVNWADNSSQTRAATLDMIYDSTTDEVGTNLPMKFRFLGKTDDTTLKYNVVPRRETALAVKRTGKDTYYNTDLELDLSGFRFSLSYNAGASAEVLGLTSTELTGSRTEKGWWYELFDNNGNATTFRRTGEKIVRLYHTTLNETELGIAYNIVSTDIPITVNNRTTGVEAISYDDTSVGVYDGINVLAETARGWELFLSEYDAVRGVITEKLLTVHYEDGTLGYVPITPEMLDYNSRVTTPGYTKVNVRYKGLSTVVYVHVRDAELDGITVEKKPTTNFIAGSVITLDGGILKITFRINELTGGQLYKYLDLDDEQITTRGFNSDIDPLVDHVQQEITVQFRDKRTTYVVTIFNKQRTTFVYQNTIFFYGNTKGAVVTPVQLIPEFDLPSGDAIFLWYVENSEFIAESDFAQYLIDHNDVTEGDFMKVIFGSVDDPTYYYVPRSALSADYFIEPANVGYDYYLVMEVAGNEFYRAENYALQKFTIIPKVIEVTALNYNERAYVKFYPMSNAHDNAMAIYYLYRELSTYVSGLVSGKVTSVELLSPNARGFEIAVFVTDDFDHESDFAAVQAIFDRVENELDREKGLRVNMTEEIRRGINVGYYNGSTPEYVSYRLAAGETLTRRNASGEDVLELLSGVLNFGAGYDYGVGEYDLTVGTLSNKNYNVDFSTGKFLVKPRAITGYSLTPANGTVDDFDQVTVMINYADGEYRYVTGDEIRYYADSEYTVAIEGTPTVAGTYYAQVGQNAFVNDQGDPYEIKFIIQYTI